MDAYLNQHLIKDFDYVLQVISIFKNIQMNNGETWKQLDEFIMVNLDQAKSRVKNKEFKADEVIPPEKLIVFAMQLKGMSNSANQLILKETVKIYKSNLRSLSPHLSKEQREELEI